MTSLQATISSSVFGIAWYTETKVSINFYLISKKSPSPRERNKEREERQSFVVVLCNLWATHTRLFENTHTDINRINQRVSVQLTTGSDDLEQIYLFVNSSVVKRVCVCVCVCGCVRVCIHYMYSNSRIAIFMKHVGYAARAPRSLGICVKFMLIFD